MCSSKSRPARRSAKSPAGGSRARQGRLALREPGIRVLRLRSSRPASSCADVHRSVRIEWKEDVRKWHPARNGSGNRAARRLRSRHQRPLDPDGHPAAPVFLTKSICRSGEPGGSDRGRARLLRRRGRAGGGRLRLRERRAARSGTSWSRPTRGADRCRRRQAHAGRRAGAARRARPRVCRDLPSLRRTGGERRSSMSTCRRSSMWRTLSFSAAAMSSKPSWRPER